MEQIKKNVLKKAKMNYELQKYKNLGLKTLFAITMAMNIVACDSPSSDGITASQPIGLPNNQSREACYNQTYNVGIPGNIYCPYKGQTINGRVEAFAQIEWSGAIYLDFGLKYNDACPPGGVPVYEYIYGQLRLKRCEPIGNDYVDYIFYNHHNTSSCGGAYAGDRNCIPDFP